MSTITDSQVSDNQTFTDNYVLNGDPARDYVSKVLQNSFYSKNDTVAYESMLRIIPVQKVTTCTLFKGGVDIEFESAMTSKIAHKKFSSYTIHTPKKLKVMIERGTGKMSFPESYSAMWVSAKLISITLYGIMYDYEKEEVTLEAGACKVKTTTTLSTQKIKEYSEQHQFN